MPHRPKSTLAALAIAGLLMIPCRAGSATLHGTRVVEGTVRLPDAGGGTLGSARITRSALTPDELSEPFPFSVTLRMRDFAGLQALVAAGARVPAAEMEERFLPLRADYDRVAAWLSAQGLVQTLQDRSHTSVFVRGSVAQVSRVFGIQFARVAVSDGEYTSAISEPSVPADLAGVVLSVNDLQPQFRLRHVRVAAAPVPDDMVGVYVYVTPDNLASAYKIPASATGAGQIIAVVGEAPVSASDLSSFWSTVGVAQTAANVTTINVSGGPVSNPSSALVFEATLDVEWAGALAPRAALRLYLAQRVFECLAQIQNDLSSYPTMSVLSISYSSIEGNYGTSGIQAYSQVAAAFAASGVSVLAASGDCGSNPGFNGGFGDYLSTAPIGVCYPASDPSVTAVGGTTVSYAGSWSYSGEVAWNEISTKLSASAGGVSGYFPRPSWQTGGSVLAGQTMRCVPDVAAIADADLQNIDLGPSYKPFSETNAGVLVWLNGTSTGAGGTSLACPVWAAITALVNQARAAAGQGAIGLLNPHLYPLAGTGAFTDVTSGNNGAYYAGPGYDLCTGLGSPNVGNLIAALSNPSPQPKHRLVNISVRSQVETGSNITIAGFVIEGPAGTTKNILVRGAGPALTAFGVAGALANPKLVLIDQTSGLLIASNTGWQTDPVAGTSTIGASFRQATAADAAAVGAFPFAAGSNDSAMVVTLPAGKYTVEAFDANGASGVALSEVYEIDTADPEVFTNISSRCFVGTGSGVAISGFVIGGSQSETLLIRGIGPALAGFGVAGALASPTLELHDLGTGNLVASNAGWSSSPVMGTLSAGASVRQATAADMSAVGAFSLTAGSADCAMVVTLPPGSYTAIVSGAASTTGTALAEVYKF
jgi:kumamolisin